MFESRSRAVLRLESRSTAVLSLESGSMAMFTQYIYNPKSLLRYPKMDSQTKGQLKTIGLRSFHCRQNERVNKMRQPRKGASHPNETINKAGDNQ